MAGHPHCFAMRSTSLQVHLSLGSYGTYGFSSGFFLHGKCLNSKFAASVATFPKLPWTRGRMSTFHVYAAKPGFGSQPKKKKAGRISQVKEETDPITRAQQILSRKQQTLEEEAQNTVAEEAPNLKIDDGLQRSDPLDEEVFERRLAEIKRAADEQKVLAEQKKYGPIDYDVPLPTPQNGLADNLGAKIGIVLVVVVFGLLFALGDFLPSGSPNADKSGMVEKKQLTKEESSKLQAQVQEFEGVLKISPEDRAALEGAAVSYAELGEFNSAEQYLSKIVQKSSADAEVLRLLAEVQNGKGDLDASVSSYLAAIRASTKKESLVLLRGLTDTLLASKKPSEAVGELLAARARLKYNFEQIKSSAQQTLLPPSSGAVGPGGLQGTANTASQADDLIDPITLDLLLGKAYAAWDGHTGDAVSVYDGLIAAYPDDYRGYLAKGVLLKVQKKGADAERMFIQARYLAPPSSKPIVDIYSGRKPS